MRKSSILLSFYILFFFSCEAIFLEDISDKKVELIAPHDNIELNVEIIRFDWKHIENATTYQLQIANPSFNKPKKIVLDTIIVNPFFNFNLPIGKYQWRVKAMNSEYNTKYNTKNLTIKN